MHAVHEMVHCVAWLTCGCDGKHGKEFKAWAGKVQERYPEIPPVTTYHTYTLRSQETERKTRKSSK
jgi:predicted SprT family Zn-dependent metalloprotease